MIGAIGFTAPWLLLALTALPILWIILRAVPPAPIRRIFPGVILLLGLKDDEQVSDRTPWWLLLLRMLALAAAIIGLAGPVLNPQDRVPGHGPLLILADGTWADARDWPRRVDRVEAALAEAARDGQRFAVVTTTPELVAAIAERMRLAGHSDRFLGTVLTEGDPEALLTSCEALEAALEEACRRARDDLAAEVIIIGGGPLAEAADALGRRLSIPIVAPVRAAARRIVETLSGRGDGGKFG